MRTHALLRVLPYVRPYIRQMLAMVAFALIGLGAGTLIPLVTKAVIDGPLADGNRAALLPLTGLALGLGLVEGFMAFLRRQVLANAALGMETRMRDDLYAHLQRLPVSFHDNWQSGQLLSRAVTDLSTIRRFIGFGVVFLFVNTVTFAVIIYLLFRLNPLLAAVTALSAIPILAVSIRFEREYSVVARRVQDEQGDLATDIEEGATGIRIIKAFGRHRLVGSRFAHKAGVLRETSLRSVELRARFWSLLSVVPSLTLAAILLGGALAVGRGTLSLGGLVAFISLLLMLVWPVEALGFILASAEEAATATTRVFEVLDTQPEIADHDGAADLPAAQGRLRFEQVGFTYPGGDTPILRNIDLDLEPGETVALIGATGSGKTTLVSLVPRLYDVTSGRVTLDGHDVRSLTLDSLRRHVGVAFEEPILFSASVRENLLLGAPDATDDQLLEAIEVAQAGFVHDLPWGFDTRVGEQGLTLSGGQRQRLALARAIVARPRVLVLDDPLSSLDVHTEAEVEEALARVLTRTTALVVVHRPSTIALADRVALLEDGTITATGTHSELMATNASYRAILSAAADDEPVASEAGKLAG